VLAVRNVEQYVKSGVSAKNAALIGAFGRGGQRSVARAKSPHKREKRGWLFGGGVKHVGERKHMGVAFDFGLGQGAQLVAHLSHVRRKCAVRFRVHTEDMLVDAACAWPDLVRGPEGAVGYARVRGLVLVEQR
jgi:hypothetical protein